MSLEIRNNLHACSKKMIMVYNTMEHYIMAAVNELEIHVLMLNFRIIMLSKRLS
jgi:hypothetical protein